MLDINETSKCITYIHIFLMASMPYHSPTCEITLKLYMQENTTLVLIFGYDVKL